MKILGISCYYHDSAACLVVEGGVVAAAQEERFSRKKHDADFPARAVAYCLTEGGIGIDDVRWVESESSDEQFEALKSGRADARFISGTGDRYKELGFHVLPLGPLPMINGPTITTSYTVLQKKKGLGERLVKAMVLGIHFTKTQRAKTERILEKLNKRTGESYSYRSLERMPRKPYPDPQAVINAYDLGCIKSPEAKEVSAFALWDLHYLRELDNSGFIDKLYKRKH